MFRHLGKIKPGAWSNLAPSKQKSLPQKEKQKVYVSHKIHPQRNNDESDSRTHVLSAHHVKTTEVSSPSR
jgi:hypothetical protein